jgi:hypothetical protein
MTYYMLRPILSGPFLVSSHLLSCRDLPVVSEKAGFFDSRGAVLQHVYGENKVIGEAASAGEVLVGFSGLHAGQPGTADHGDGCDLTVGAWPHKVGSEVIAVVLFFADGDTAALHGHRTV